LVYRPDLNNPKLENLARIKIIEPPSKKRSAELLSAHIEGLVVPGGSDAILEFFFTGRLKGRYPRMIMVVYPSFEEVDYSLKKGDFFANQGVDPIVIRHSWECPRPIPGRKGEFRGPEISDYLLLRSHFFDKSKEYAEEIALITGNRDI